MGVASSSEGKVYCTDDDNIAVKYFNRHQI
jgi:hypothetical protein